jgi:hypothetical protein
MKTRLLEVAGLNLKISLYNNVLVLSCNIDGHCNYETRRIISNSILSESEIFEKMDSEWVFKIFSKYKTYHQCIKFQRQHHTFGKSSGIF